MRRLFSSRYAVPSFFLFLGLLFFAIGSGMTLRQRTLEKQGIEVPGSVVGLQENCDSDGCSYAPAVEFTTASGQNIQFVSSYYSNPPSYDVGESVMVVYPPGNPTNAIIKGDGQMLHIVFMLVGGVVATVGLYQFYIGIRNMAVSNSGE